jgi:hypothetical protein
MPESRCEERPRPERRLRRRAGEEDVPAVGDDGVEGAEVAAEDDVAVVDVEAGRVVVAEVRVVDDVAEDRRAAGDLAALAVLPEHAA